MFLRIYFVHCTTLFEISLALQRDTAVMIISVKFASNLKMYIEVTRHCKHTFGEKLA